jgi:hypothetical protein
MELKNQWNIIKVVISISVLLLLCNSKLFAIPWPLERTSPTHRIGNSYGEYQFYGGNPAVDSYLHPGLDILTDWGERVYAVRSGWVKAVLTISADLHWRVAMGDAPGSGECDGWLYAHLDQSSITVAPGDYVEEGDYLGDIVYWPTADFHHIHFVKIRSSGQYWNADWDFIANPLDELAGIVDLTPPIIRHCSGEYLFAFCRNGTHDYFDHGAVISGDVDIIARVDDVQNEPLWRLAPYALAYEIYNDTMSTGIIPALTFTGELFYEQNVGVTYQDDAYYNTEGDYDNRDYYFIITNTDGDSVIEASDTAGCWRTTDFDNGPYWVRVYAYDRDDLELTDNISMDSMQVFIENVPPCLCDGFCDLDASGSLNPLDVTIIVNYVYRSLDSRLPLPNCPLDNGDWDCSAQVTPVDVAFYVNYVYRSFGTGPCDPCGL